MSERRGRKILIVVLSIVGVVILACGGLIYWGSGALADLSKAQNEADAFLNLIGAEKLDEAYAATAPAFRSKVTPEQFRDLIKKYPAFTKQTRRSLGGMRIYARPEGTQAQIQYNLASPNNTLSLMMVLVKVNGRWQVESVNLP
jgi:hypothetical protein